MILREDNGYIKLYYYLTDGDGNLFGLSKKESALIGKMMDSQNVPVDDKNQASIAVDLFDKIAITDDDSLSFDSALDDCFYSVAEAFKKFGLDYKNLSEGAVSMVQRETVDEKSVYAIYFTDRGAVSDATIALLDDLLLKYIIYTLVQYTAKYMNGNKYLDIRDKILMRLSPIEGLLYQSTMEKSKNKKGFVYYGTLPINVAMSGAAIELDNNKTVERLRELPDAISCEVPDGYYFYIAFPSDWGSYNFISYTGRELIGTFFSANEIVNRPNGNSFGNQSQTCTILKTDWSGEDVVNFTFKRI